MAVCTHRSSRTQQFPPLFLGKMGAALTRDYFPQPPWPFPSDFLAGLSFQNLPWLAEQKRRKTPLFCSLYRSILVLDGQTIAAAQHSSYFPKAYGPLHSPIGQAAIAHARFLSLVNQAAVQHVFPSIVILARLSSCLSEHQRGWCLGRFLKVPLLCFV
jgi:hypothetical protein